MRERIQKTAVVWIACAASILLACAITIAQSGAPSGQKPGAAQPKVKLPVETKPLSQMSEGDLLKNGEAFYKAGDLLKAHERLTLGLAKKKKPDTKYGPMLTKVKELLADEEAAAAEIPCKQMDLVACERRIAAAKVYETTPNVIRLSNTLSRGIQDLESRLQAALKQSASGDYDGALNALRELTKYSSHLKSIDADIERTTKSFVGKLVSDGMRGIDEKRFEDASLTFQRVLDLDKNNASAKSGLSVVQKARSAYEQQSRALQQVAAKRFDEALKLIDLANETYPTTEFERTKGNIVRDYVAFLAAPVERMVAEANDFVTIRDAYLRLDQVRNFDPGHPAVAKYLPEVSENLGTQVLQRAANFEEIVDYSRIATAYLLKVNAQKRLPAGIVKSEDIKTVASAFSRKRLSHLILSVDNLATTQATDFARTLQQKARHTLESVALSDLRVCPFDDKKCIEEDAQFESFRPDGKSRAAILTISVARYDFSQTHTDTATLRSKWVNGTEDIPNPAYREKETELDRMRRALDKPGQKKDKPTPEGWTEATYLQKERELGRIDKTIRRDKVVDYSYSKTDYTQRTNLELNVLLRDNASKQELKSDRIRSNIPETRAEEIEGVKDTDVNSLQNKRLRLPSRDEALEGAERNISEELDKKILEMVPVYTNRFFNEGERRMKANQVDDAVEAYICHFAFLRGKMPAAQMERLTEVVKRETGLDLKSEGDAFIALLD